MKFTSVPSSGCGQFVSVIAGRAMFACGWQTIHGEFAYRYLGWLVGCGTSDWELSSYKKERRKAVFSSHLSLSSCRLLYSMEVIDVMMMMVSGGSPSNQKRLPIAKHNNHRFPFPFHR
jgi:hypothetical protein